MFKYLTAAFFVRPSVPGLGAVPVNVIAAIAFGVFGFVQPAIWLLGAGVIGSFCFALASSERFRKITDAAERQIGDGQVMAKRAELVSSLDQEARSRLASVMQRCGRIMEAYRKSGSDDFALKTSGEALDRLQWVYLKLLLARQSLAQREDEIDERQLQREIESIEKELQSEKLSTSMRQSRQATLELLNKRLANRAARQQTAAEIDSDLRRVETQIDVALDDATMSSTPSAINVNIELASQLMDASIFGARGQAIADLDQTFGSSGQMVKE